MPNVWNRAITIEMDVSDKPDELRFCQKYCAAVRLVRNTILINILQHNLDGSGRKDPGLSQLSQVEYLVRSETNGSLSPYHLST